MGTHLLETPPPLWPRGGAAADGRGFWNLLSLHPVRKQGTDETRFCIGVQLEMDRQEIADMMLEVQAWERKQAVGTGGGA